MQFGNQPCRLQVKFLSLIRFGIGLGRALPRRVAGVNQLGQKGIVQGGLIAAGLLGQELAKRILPQCADGFSLTPGSEVGGSKFGGAALLQLLLALALGDGLLGLAQNRFDELQLGGRNPLLRRTLGRSVAAPLRGFGQTVLQGAQAHDGFLEALAGLAFEQKPDAEQSLELKLEAHYSAMVSSAAMVRSMDGISAFPWRAKARKFGITCMARSRSGSEPFW